MTRSPNLAWVPAVVLCIAYLPAPAPVQDCAHLPPLSAELPEAVPNDNRTPAGALHYGVLSVSLELREVAWRPDGAAGCAIRVFAFAESGKAPQIPGPLLRAPAGTELRVTVRNSLTAPSALRGFQDARRTAAESIVVWQLAPGATETFTFRVTAPGTYFYFARGSAQAPGPLVPANEFGQTAAALIVDPPEGSPPDRIFVATRWRPPPPSPAREQGYELNAFNGRSWPQTERLSTTVGDTVRWRVIAANNDGHAMHLHGFYFLVESKGTPTLDTVYTTADQRRVVSEIMAPGGTMRLLWVPERSGNWIFHCHVLRHMVAAQRLDQMPGAAGAVAPDVAHDAHAMHEMAGLVLGVTVRAAASSANPAQDRPRRTLRLFANERARVFGERTGYGFVLQEGPRAPVPDSVRLPGSPLVLTRGEPVQITVKNRLSQPLSVHWHGIELESYFDGVAGWSGTADRPAPAIAPGDSFVVRLTPPRAGTFMYHVHNEASDELSAGLYGPLLVVEPGAPHDPVHNPVFVIAQPGVSGLLSRGLSPFVNGRATSDTLTLVTGETYRLRIITISASAFFIVRLKRGVALEEWKAVARDGADLPPPQALRGQATLATGPGMTFDYEYTPREPGNVLLEVEHAIPGVPRVAPPAIVPIRVRQR